jgi:c-di-GMP-related signal transduction protein
MMGKLTSMVEQAKAVEKPILAPHVENAEGMALIFQCGFDFAQGNFLQEPDVVMQFDFGDAEKSVHGGMVGI